jgi:hypothetical protein
MSFLFGALVWLPVEDVSGQKGKNVILTFFPIPGRIALRKCCLLAAGKTTRLCDSCSEGR